MADIYMGAGAVNRETVLGSYTLVDKSNPANASGKITSVEIWANTNMLNVEIGIFSASGDVLTTRSNVTIGNVAAGEHSISNGNPIVVDSEGNPISLNVEGGNYIGIFYTSGNLEVDTSGGVGIWYIRSDDNIPCTNVTFNYMANYAISLYGTGTTVAAGIKWNGVTITKWNGQVITKLNGLP